MREYNKYDKPFILTTRDNPGNTIILSYHKTKALADRAFYKRRKASPNMTLIVERNYNTEAAYTTASYRLVNRIRNAKTHRLEGNIATALIIEEVIDDIYRIALKREELGVILLIEEGQGPFGLTEPLSLASGKSSSEV